MPKLHFSLWVATIYNCISASVTKYRGNVIYRDGKVDMVLFPGGYATINGTAVTFHYYTQDYLGKTHGGQPYRFGGKELVTANGLIEYGFGLR